MICDIPREKMKWSVFFENIFMINDEHNEIWNEKKKKNIVDEKIITQVYKSEVKDDKKKKYQSGL